MVIPRALCLCLATLIVTAIALTVGVCSQSPGLTGVADTSYPLSAGYAALFGISDRAATVLSLPGAFATAFGFIYSFNKQISAMAASGMLPTALTYTWGPNQTHVASLLCGSLLSFCVQLIVYYTNFNHISYTFKLSVYGSYFVYLFNFGSYIIFRNRYEQVEKSFTNPLGVSSAYIGIFIFMVALVALLGFSDEGYIPLVCFIGIVIALTVYYFSYARYHQKYSEHEQQVMLKAYVINRKPLSL